MSNYYSNYNQYINSKICCNISLQDKIGPQGPQGEGITGPRGITGYQGLSITGPTGPSKRGPTGPTGHYELFPVDPSYSNYLLSEKFLETSEYLKIQNNGNYYWIPLISQDPTLPLESPELFFSSVPEDYTFEKKLDNFNFLLKWEPVPNASYYKVFYYIYQNKGRQFIINNNFGTPRNRYGINSFKEIYSGNDTSVNHLFSYSYYYNIYIFAYDNLGNRSSIPSKICFLKSNSIGDYIEYSIWGTCILSFQNGISNYNEFMDSSYGTIEYFNKYSNIIYGPYTFSYLSSSSFDNTLLYIDKVLI